MTFSGTMLATTINLKAGTVTDDVNLAGNGSLGPFTFHELHADNLTPPNSLPSLAQRRCSFRVETAAGCIALPRRKPPGRQAVVAPPPKARKRYLHRPRTGKARLTETYRDHRWNQTFEGCVRHPYVDGDGGAGLCSTLWRGPTSFEYGDV